MERPEGKPKEKPAERELIRLAASGDAAAFERLVERYQSFVFSVVAKLVPQNDVPDVANETFLHFFRSLEGYRGEGSLESWLATIATRRAYDHWRIVWRHRERAVSGLSADAASYLESAAGGAAREKHEEDEENRMARDVVVRLLDQLSPDDRIVVSLVHLEELPIAEVARRLGWSKVRVKVRAHRARNRMKELAEEMLK